MNKLTDRCKGAIFGHAVGDALGLGAEFMSKTEVGANYPNGLGAYADIVQDRHRRRWRIGDWTDDTDQMLCIFDSILENRAIDVLDIAKRIYTWVRDDGMGIGNTVWAVVRSRYFLTAPHFAAQYAWEESGRQVAPNGGVMRTSILGVWQYESLSEVKTNAEKVCRITHFDPRCVGSCVAVCTAIALLLQGKDRFDEIFETVKREAASYSPEVIEYLDRSATGELEDFDLDEGLNSGETNRFGFTLKALGASFWALKNAPSYREGLLRIIHEGGDADTNAAVAGALLGARDGFSAIPQRWIDELLDRQALQERIQRLLPMLGIEPLAQAPARESMFARLSKRLGIRA